MRFSRPPAGDRHDTNLGTMHEAAGWRYSWSFSTGSRTVLESARSEVRLPLAIAFCYCVQPWLAWILP
ncbi:MAG: hypothetical protein ABSG53_02010 [Thermoguttaceae bacterium]